MKTPKTFLLLSVVAAVLVLGVAYAAIQNVTLEVNGTATAGTTDANFKVYFDAPDVTTDTQTNATVAYTVTEKLAKFTVTGLDAAGETATVTLTINNDSEDIIANIPSVNVSNSKPNYFEVTDSISDLTINPKSSVTITITVKLIKNPVSEDVSTDITATFVAVPSEA